MGLSCTVLCGALYTACVDASGTVFWDCSQPCVHDSKFGEHSWESLQVMDATVIFYGRIKVTLCFSVWDFRLDMQITRRFAVLAA